MILVHVQLTRVCFLEHWFIFLSYQFYIYIFFSRLSKFKFHRFDVRVVSNLFLKEQLQFRDCTRDMLQIYFINITYNCWNSIAWRYVIILISFPAIKIRMKKRCASVSCISPETEAIALSSERAARFEDLETDTSWNWIRTSPQAVFHMLCFAAGDQRNRLVKIANWKIWRNHTGAARGSDYYSKVSARILLTAARVRGKHLNDSYISR